MDDYDEFRHIQQFEIKQWYWSHNYVSIIIVTMAPNRMSTTLNINLANGNKSASGGGTTKSGKTNGSGSATTGGVI